ncbi:MAG: hypothetical protein AAF597_16115, partial [Bacteroidota bacterium]
VDIEFQAVCDDGTTAFQVLQYTVGASSPISLGYIDATGAPYTLSGGPLTSGFCDGSTAAASIDYNTSVSILCDDGTPFYRVAVFSLDTITPTAVADYELDLVTTYTTSGTVYPGPCSLTTDANLSRTIVTGAGSIPSGAYSFEICNEGTNNATVTIGSGSAETLIPGSCVRFSARYIDELRQYRVAPAVSYDATGTQLMVYFEN